MNIFRRVVKKEDEEDNGDAAVILNSDLHSGSSLAIWCPDSRLPKGGTFRNEVTDWIWQEWTKANEWEQALTKGRRKIRVFNGDLVQGIADPFAEMVTNLSEYQERNAIEVIDSVVSENDKVVIMRGTSRHDGPEGESAERIAKELGCKQHGNEYSQFAATISVNGVRIHITHHIGTSRSPVSKVTALMSSLAMMDLECARWGQPIPDILARAHRHEYDYIHIAGKGQGQAVVTTPSWAAKGEYAIKVSPNTVAHVGRVIFLVDKGGGWRAVPHYSAIEDDEVDIL